MIPFVIVILLALSAVCSATETAFSSVNRIRLKNLAAGAKAHRRRWILQRILTRRLLPYLSETTL